MEILEKTLYHDGIAFLQYRLAYPSGEDFSFAEKMTRGYAAYLEETYFEKLCAVYNADCDRRRRFHHKLVQVTQTCRLYQKGNLCSLCVNLTEGDCAFAFAFTWDKERGVLMKLRDFGVKRSGGGFFYDGRCVYIFSKKGTLDEKIAISI